MNTDTLYITWIEQGAQDVGQNPPG